MLGGVPLEIAPADRKGDVGRVEPRMERLGDGKGRMRRDEGDMGEKGLGPVTDSQSRKRSVRKAVSESLRREDGGRAEGPLRKDRLAPALGVGHVVAALLQVREPRPGALGEQRVGLDPGREAFVIAACGVAGLERRGSAVVSV